ncbi:MAG: hypothetical protein JNK89_06415 [Saprospiraceae bacterium]|nr:hypothetical protein [Saprospiraceae bacterium]
MKPPIKILKILFILSKAYRNTVFLSKLKFVGFNMLDTFCAGTPSLLKNAGQLLRAIVLRHL